MQLILARWNVNGQLVVRSFEDLEVAILTYRRRLRGHIVQRPARRSFQYSLDGANWIS